VLLLVHVLLGGVHDVEVLLWPLDLCAVLLRLVALPRGLLERGVRAI
jgi:hypothetical protein